MKIQDSLGTDISTGAVVEVFTKEGVIRDRIKEIKEEGEKVRVVLTVGEDKVIKKGGHLLPYVKSDNQSWN